MNITNLNLPHLTAQVFGVPHYVTQQTMDAVKAVLLPRIQGTMTDPVFTMALNPDGTPTPEQVQPGAIRPAGDHRRDR